MIWIIAAIVLIGLVYAFLGFSKTKEKTSQVFSKIIEKRGGSLSRLPNNPVYPALKINIEGEDAYFSITNEELIFFVASDKLKDYMPMWVSEGKPYLAWKRILTNNAEFDKKFYLYNVPVQGSQAANFSVLLQDKILRLEAEVSKQAVNVFLEINHVSTTPAWFTITVHNFLLKQELLKFETEAPAVYEGILDKCVAVYQAFKQSGRN